MKIYNYHALLLNILAINISLRGTFFSTKLQRLSFATCNFTALLRDVLITPKPLLNLQLVFLIYSSIF